MPLHWDGAPPALMLFVKMMALPSAPVEKVSPLMLPPLAVTLPPEMVGELCRANPDRLVIVDEAYADFALDSCVRLLPQYDFLEPVIPYAAYDDFRSFCAAAPYDLASLAISPRYAPKEADFIADVFREYITEV